MKASVVTAYGGLELMRYQDMPDPKLGAGDIRDGIAFIADAVNSGKMTIPIGRREQLKNAGTAQAAFTKGGIGKVLLTP